MKSFFLYVAILVSAFYANANQIEVFNFDSDSPIETSEQNFDRSHGYYIIFCMDGDQCRKWNSYGPGNPRSRSLEWHFTGNYNQDKRSCRDLADVYMSRKHGASGRCASHMESTGGYNPISYPRSYGSRHIYDYCRKIVNNYSY